MHLAVLVEVLFICIWMINLFQIFFPSEQIAHKKSCWSFQSDGVSAASLIFDILLSLDLAPPPPCRLPWAFSPPHPRGLHSRRSSLAHVNECRFYLETWPLVTAQCHIISQRLTNICLEWAFSYSQTQTRGHFHPHAGFSLLLCRPNFCRWKLHGGGGSSVCVEDGGGRLCGRRSPRV